MATERAKRHWEGGFARVIPTNYHFIFLRELRLRSPRRWPYACMLRRQTCQCKMANICLFL